MLELDKKVVKSFKITVDGQEYGEVEPSGIDSDDVRWHAVFCGLSVTERKNHYASAALIQGFGETPVEAVKNAFIETEKRLELHLAQLRELRVKTIPVEEVEVEA